MPLVGCTSVYPRPTQERNASNPTCLFFDRKEKKYCESCLLEFPQRKHFLVARRSQQCITCDDIPVLVRATLALRVMGDAEKGEDPTLVRKFVHEVGVRGLEAQLINAVVRIQHVV